MTTDEQIEYARKVFLKLTITDTQRLSNGIKIREEMWATIKKGQRAKGYRPDWVRNSAKKIKTLLEAITQDFNMQHSDDKASTLDMLDILATVRSDYEKKTKK